MARRRKKVSSGEPVTESAPVESVGIEEEAPQPSVAWGTVIRDCLRIGNPAKLADQLRADLRIAPEALESYPALMKALEASAKNIDDSALLYRAAKVEENRFSIEKKERMEVLRSAAHGELMTEYKNKERKSPTKEDVSDRMLSCWPDEYRALENNESELHGAVKSLEMLMKAWVARNHDLRVMVETFSRKLKG
jgi:hypothetical protein